MENTAVTKEPLHERIWFKYGYIAGGISILITLVYYLIDESMMGNWALAMIPALVLYVAGIIAAVDRKKKQGGYISFASAMATSLGTLLVALILSSIFSLILYYIIDPGLMDRMMEAQFEMMEEKVAQGEMSEAQLEMSRSMMSNTTFGVVTRTAIGLVSSLLIGLVIYLISSAIIKREPEY